MACPFFMPTTKCDDGSWIHPARLPLGNGWHGQCSAPGHEGSEPTPDQLREFCNLGYASRCPRLPKQRTADAVRLAVTHDQGTRLTVCFVYESAHRPAGHGTLEYDRAGARWLCPHPDPRIQKMADCCLQSYLLRRIQPAAAGLLPSEKS
jgi:hypothetical protein